MDGMLISNSNQATIRLLGASRNGSESPILGAGWAGDAAVDTIELTSAVRSPEETADLRLGPYLEGNPQARSPSLPSLLEAIKIYIEESLYKARQRDQYYFEQIHDLRSRVSDASGAGNLEVIGDLVAAAAPESREAFLLGAKKLLDQVKDPASQLLGAGDDSSKLEFAVSNLDLGIETGEGQGLTVKLKSFKLTASSFSSLGLDAPSPKSVVLEASDGIFKVIQEAPDTG